MVITVVHWRGETKTATRRLRITERLLSRAITGNLVCGFSMSFKLKEARSVDAFASLRALPAILCDWPLHNDDDDSYDDDNSNDN